MKVCKPSNTVPKQVNKSTDSHLVKIRATWTKVELQRQMIVRGETNLIWKPVESN